MDIHLIDGTYELFRAYFGAPKTEGPGGLEVGAVRGLIRSLMALVRNGATHLACAFDSRIESFRNQLFEGYKTGEGIEPELKAQFPVAEQAVAACGITVFPMVEFEADDALATAARQLQQEPRVERILICSADKDLAQCVVGDRIILFDRRRNIILNADGVNQKYGVPPTSIPDWLALVGDAADGIPGLRGWGAKSSASVLSRFTNIESIPPDYTEWPKVRGAAQLATTLNELRDTALFYRSLTTLRLDVPLKFSLDGLAWKTPESGTWERLATEFALEERAPWL